MADDEQKLAYFMKRKLMPRLYAKYQDYETDEERLQHIPKGLSAEDWQLMLRHFTSPEFQLRAAKYRKDEKAIARTGSKPFAQLEYHLMNDEVLSMMKVWMAKHTTLDANKKRKWTYH